MSRAEIFRPPATIPPIPQPATTVTGPDAFGAAAVVGTATTYAREDHDHGLPAAGSSALTTVTKRLPANTSVTGASWQDVIGMTGISLTAGVWVALIEIEYSVGSSGTAAFRLTDGTVTFAQSGVHVYSSLTGGDAHHSFSSVPFTLGSTDTLKLQMFATASTWNILRYPAVGADTSIEATTVTFIKVG